jgi:sugar (pentulose or hexulose) kinase
MLALQADEARPLVRLVDTDNELFYTPGDMPRRIQEYCRSTGQPVPETKGEIVRCIFESLCCKYRLALEEVRRSTGRTITKLRVGGGGSGNNFLMQITADALGCRVLAGPKEASGFGNVMVQLMALGEVKDLWQGRELVAESCGVTEYEPHNRDGWEEAMDRYHRILKRYAEKSKTQGI